MYLFVSIGIKTHVHLGRSLFAYLSDGEPGSLLDIFAPLKCMQLLLPGALHLQQIVRISVSKKENEDCLCWENGFYWCHCHGGTVFCRPGSRRCSDMIVLAGVAVTRSFCTRNSWLRRARMERRSLEVVFLRQWSLEVDSASMRSFSKSFLDGDKTECPFNVTAAAWWRRMSFARTCRHSDLHALTLTPRIACRRPRLLLAIFFFLYSQYWFIC